MVTTFRCRTAKFLTVGIAIAYLTIFPSFAHSEWYVSGYGGMSTTGNLSDVTMPQHGQRLAFQQFPFADPSVGAGSLTQTFSASDIKLESSPIFGGKAGYFFTEGKLPWLGVEVEAFTSKPSIKAQTLTTKHDIFYTPSPSTEQFPCLPGTCPEARVNNDTLVLTGSDLRVITVAFNVIARYPGQMLQPYVGVGVGAFYFKGTEQFDGRQVYPGLNALAGLRLLVTEEWGVFVEGKYNLANVSNFDPNFGLSGTYSVFHGVAGVAYHF